MSGRSIGERLSDEGGVTLAEVMVVLLILGIVLAGMTTLFVSAGTSQVEQTNRVEAQRNARLALDALRRELRCASDVIAVTPSRLTIELPGYCRKPPVAGTADVTWCAVGGPAPAPYALWRYASSSCSGTGVRKAESLVSNVIFAYNRSTSGPDITQLETGLSVTDGYFKPGTYTYTVTAVTSGGEISGTPEQVTFATGSPNQITVRWDAYAGALSYNVYGREDGSRTVDGLRKLANVPAGSTSYVDFGCATRADGCSPAVVVDGSLASPPLAKIRFSLVFDVTTADGRQRFKLEDDVVLRNSGRR